MKRYMIAILSLVLLLVISACSGTENTNNNIDPNTPVDSDQPMPVEPDGGPGGDLNDDGKDQANARVEQTELLIMESYPVQIMLVVSGALPTPCHQFRYQVSEPDADNQIFVEVYSMVDPGEVCIEVEDPFSENISLPVAGLPDGVYTVYVNGELVGEFSYPG